jgi:carbamoylphosphate synthase large subunit
MDIKRIRHRGEFGERIFELRNSGLHFEDIAHIIKDENPYSNADRYYVEREYNRIKSIIKKCKNDQFLEFLGGDGVLKKYLITKKGIRNEMELKIWLEDPENVKTLDRRTHGCLSEMKLI